MRQSTGDGGDGGAAMLTVVIPCRNEAGRLAGQLRALAAQRGDAEFEVVVSDNGSTDATREVAGRFAGELDLRIVDSSGRRGRSHACNVGARAARGDRVAFVDADDEVAPGYVAAMAEALSRSEFVAARLDCETLNGGWPAASREPFQHDGPLDVFGFLPFAIGCSLGVSRRAFDLVGGFTDDVPYAEDVEFCWLLQLRGVPLAFAPDAVVRYRYRDTLRGLYRQTRGYGLGQAALYRKFRRHGMPGRSLPLTVREWYWVFRAVTILRSRRGAALWFHMLGYRVGRLRGSVRFRTLYL